MPANPLNFGAIVVAPISNILSNALPVIAVAVFGLVVAVACVLLLFSIFGFRVGFSQHFKDKLRRKRGKFPLAVRRRVTGIKADAKSPWTAPAAWADTNVDELFDATAADGDLAFFTNVNEMMRLSTLYILHGDDKPPLMGAERDAHIAEIAAIYKRRFKQHSDNVVANWSMTFSHLGSLAGLADSNLDFETKRVFFRHAAKLTRMKMDALAENRNEWAKQYGDGMASSDFEFVA